MRKLKVAKRFIRLRGSIQKVYEVVEREKTVTLGGIQNLTDVNYNTIRSSIINLTKYGLIERTGRGTYTLKAESTDTE